MPQPLEITFKDIAHDSRMEDLISDKFDKLKQACHGITKCRVILEGVSKSHQKGNACRVELSLKQAHFPDIFIAENIKKGERSFETAIRAVFKKTQDLARQQILRRKQQVQRSDKAGGIPVEEAVD